MRALSGWGNGASNIVTRLRFEPDDQTGTPRAKQSRELHRRLDRRRGTDRAHARRQLLLELLRRQLLEVAGVEAGGVVDQHVDAAKAVDGGAHRRLGVTQSRDVQLDRCVVHFRSGGEAYRWELEKAGRERQVAVTGALFENDPRIAVRAVLTGEVIGFAFEAQMATHLANVRSKPCSMTGAELPRFPSLLPESPRGHAGAASVHRDHEERQLAS